MNRPAAAHIPLALLLMLALVLPIAPLPADQYRYDMARWAQLVVFLGLGLQGLRLKNSAAPVISPAMTLLLALGCSSTLLAPQPLIAMRDGALFLAIICAIRVTAERLRQPGQMQWVMKAIVLGLLCYGVITILIAVPAICLEGSVDSRLLFSGYENPRHFNHVQTLVIPILAGAIDWEPLEIRWRRLAHIALAIQMCLLTLALGRATCLALLGSTLFVVWQLGGAGRQFAWRLIQAGLAGMVLYGLIAVALPALLGVPEHMSLRRFDEKGSFQARIYLWGIALKDIAQHPWIGMGPMHFAHHFNAKGAHPHNIYLQIAAEYGLPFFTLALFCLIRALANCTRLIKEQGMQRSDALLVGGFVATLAALIDGGFSGNFVMPLPQAWMVIAGGLLCARLPASTSGNAPSRSGTAGTRYWRALIMALLMVLSVILFQASQEMQRSNVNLVNGAANPGDRLRPRFWLDGWF